MKWISEYKEVEIRNAFNFACKYHKNKYDGKHYTFHLKMVHDLLLKHKASLDIRIAGILHDILEDTECTYEQLCLEFGENIANIVLAVSNLEGKNRKEKWAITSKKIIAQGHTAISIKLADRICNFYYSLETNNISKIKMYLKEDSSFNNIIPKEEIEVLNLELYNVYSSTVNYILDVYLSFRNI